MIEVIIDAIHKIFQMFAQLAQTDIIKPVIDFFVNS